jgi:hypothetical protein
MDLCHHGSAFADCRRDTLRRAGADVTDRKYVWNAGFQRQNVAAGSEESFFIRRSAVLQPRGIRFGANEQKQMT